MPCKFYSKHEIWWYYNSGGSGPKSQGSVLAAVQGLDCYGYHSRYFTIAPGHAHIYWDTLPGKPHYAHFTKIDHQKAAEILGYDPIEYIKDALQKAQVP